MYEEAKTIAKDWVSHKPLIKKYALDNSRRSTGVLLAATHYLDDKERADYIVYVMSCVVDG
jgi:hypothetical protein